MANNWIELNGKKEPPFKTEMLIMLAGTNAWVPAILKEKRETDNGRSYVFYNLVDPELEYQSASHYMIPEPPKAKE